MNALIKHSKLLQKIAISVMILGVLLLGMDYSKFNSSIGNIHIDAIEHGDERHRGDR